MLKKMSILLMSVSLVAFVSYSNKKTNQIEALIKAENIKTPEELLKKLGVGSQDPYALIYKSDSPQGATFEDPRVVWFIDDAKFVIAYNHLDNQEEPFNTFDVLELNEKTNEYESAIIEFDPEAYEKAKVTKNPASCVLCHSNF